jgi:hypothetical protein
MPRSSRPPADQITTLVSYSPSSNRTGLDTFVPWPPIALRYYRSCVPGNNTRNAVWLYSYPHRTRTLVVISEAVFSSAAGLRPKRIGTTFLCLHGRPRVLDGPPRIPYLHMTEMRSSGWRNEHGLSRLDADDRIDSAITVIDQMQSLYPIRIDVMLMLDTFETN